MTTPLWQQHVTSTRVGVLLMLWWTAILFIPDGWKLTGQGVSRIAVGAAIAWYLLNFYAWMVPEWRRNFVERRGPLLGIGFAFGAACIGAVIDALLTGWPSGLAAFAWRWLLLTLPFLVPFAFRPSPYPHRLDLIVLLYALALPRIPGFDGVWATLAHSVGGGFFVGGTAGASRSVVLGPGHLAALGLIAAYFYGARAWSAAPLDWRLRSGDGLHVLRTAGFALLGVAATVMALSVTGADPLEAMRANEALLGPGGSLAGSLSRITLALCLAAPSEALVFRGLLQSGLPHWLPPRLFSGDRRLRAALALVTSVGAHVALGAYALPWPLSLGFAAGLALAYQRCQRFLPAALGQALSLALIGLALTFYGA